ncbi:hypothetical protein [Herpetosiphon sp. NSE202]|uniref:hypothetical protein n=1 Tax=Herpetosiphon sp. NSE202 TaxID=3351349 RepID=UPI003631CD9A
MSILLVTGLFVKLKLGCTISQIIEAQLANICDDIRQSFSLIALFWLPNLDSE